MYRPYVLHLVAPSVCESFLGCSFLPIIAKLKRAPYLNYKSSDA